MSTLWPYECGAAHPSDVAEKRKLGRNVSESGVNVRFPDVALFAEDLEVLDDGFTAQAPWNNMIHVQSCS